MQGKKKSTTTSRTLKNSAHKKSARTVGKKSARKTPTKRPVKKKASAPAKKKPRPALPVKKKGAVKKKTASKKNKLGVNNSLVNNINARRKKGVARSEKKSTISKKSYRRMKTNWDE